MRKILVIIIFLGSVLFANNRCGFSNHLQHDSQVQRINPPDLDTFISSPTGHFYIHYDTTGSDAPNLVDLNDNSIPDYVDEVGIMADSIRYVLVDVMGYLPEPEDDDGVYDIYLQDRGYLNYGINTPINGSGASYLIIDNEYEEGDYYIPGINTMRLTLAHEFFHAIQRGYKAYPTFFDAFFYELTSTWIEDVVVPDGDDYLNWVDDFFDDPDQRWDDTDGYSLALFGHYLTTILDTPNQMQSTIMREIWERIEIGDTPIEAINYVLGSEYSSSFAEVWVDFVSRNLFNQVDDSFYYYEDQGLIEPIFTDPESEIGEFTLNLNNESVAIQSFHIDETSFLDIHHSNNNFLGTLNYIGQNNNILSAGDGYTEGLYIGDELHFVYATESSYNNLTFEINQSFFIYGCMDEEACNFNELVDIDNGTCIYPEDNYDCDGNCIVDVDCNGECGGSAELDDCFVCDGGNDDLDDCGVCFGENGCYGCTDEDAINYNEEATNDDGNCEYTIWFRSGNPVVSEIVQFELDEYKSNIKVNIYDVRGKLKQYETSGQIINIPVQSFASGIYFLHVMVDDKIILKRKITIIQ